MVFNILLSIFVCVAASLFFAWMVTVRVSASYVVAGSTHELSLQSCSSVTLDDVADLANAVHSAVILL